MTVLLLSLILHSINPGLMPMWVVVFIVAKTNPTVAIWLGKQELGQTDNPNDKSDMGLIPSLMGVINRAANRN